MCFLVCCTQYLSKFGKLSSGYKTNKSVFIPVRKKGNAIECSNHTTVPVLHASNVMLKILQARLQQRLNQELPDVQAGFRKGRGNRSNCQHPLNQRKQGNSRKTFTSASVDVRLSLWWCRSQQTVENSERDGNTRPPDLPPEKSACRSRSNS